MQKIQFSEIKNLVEYEKVRESVRARNIELTARRRVSVGDRLSFLFENRETVLFQIQEMIRTERIVEDRKIQDEIDTYNGLIPGPGELSATLFIEIPEIARLAPAEVRRIVDRFLGLDHEKIWLTIGERFRIAARFDSGTSREERMAAVHFLRLALPADARAALADSSQDARLVADHPNYHAEQSVPAEVRAELLKDLAH